MKKIAILLTAVSAICLCSCGNNTENKTGATADNKDTMMATPKNDTMAAEPKLDSATQMKLWMAYMTPGEMHKMMASMNGKWSDSITMWQAAGAPPMMSTSSSENSMILNGLYQQSIHKGDMMGKPFEGRSLMAYDNAAKKFVNTWVDNMGSGIMVLEGPWDEANKTITLKGHMVSPETGKDMDIREVIKIVDDKHQVMEMYCNQNGKEFKNMEIHSMKK